ncbi:MAG: hypothetical protein O7B26_03800 [Planctomycetota bacterium]|nr:hypothetical protein [Planctomycetota bacterium]
MTVGLFAVVALWLLSTSTKTAYAPNDRLRFSLADGMFSVAWNDMLGAVEGLSFGRCDGEFGIRWPIATVLGLETGLVHLPVWIPFLAFFLPALTFWRKGLRQQIYRRIWPHHCQKCRANLTGNLTGRCQSCKTPYLSDDSSRFSTRRRSGFTRLMFKGAIGVCLLIVIVWMMSFDWELGESAAPALRWDYRPSATSTPAPPVWIRSLPRNINTQQYVAFLRAARGPGPGSGTEFWFTARGGDFLFNWRSLIYGIRDGSERFPLDRTWADRSRLIRPFFMKDPKSQSGFIMVPMGLPLALAGLAAFFLWWRIRPNPYGYCRSCGYNLTGNVTGRCPECQTSCDPRQRNNERRQGRWSRRLVITATLVLLMLAATIYWIGTSRAIGRVGDGWTIGLHSDSLTAQWWPGSAGEPGWRAGPLESSPPRYWPAEVPSFTRPDGRVVIPLSLVLAPAVILFSLTLISSWRRWQQ